MVPFGHYYAREARLFLLIFCAQYTRSAPVPDIFVSISFPLATADASHNDRYGDVIFITTISNLPASETVEYELQSGVNTSYLLGTKDLFYLNISE